MPQPSKFFRVAVAGETVDGRKIEESWLTDMAAGYNPETYAARMNMEHIRGITADKPFKALGDVVALKTEKIDLAIGGKTEKRLALFAQVEPTDDLRAINKDGQKLYSSIEVNPSFAGTNKAYLVGLAVTDSPASLGTERLQFAAKANSNLLSPALETTIELAAEPSDGSDTAGLISAAKAFFTSLTAKPAPAADPTPPVLPVPANDNDARFTAVASGLEKMTSAIEKLGTDLRADLASLRSEHDALKASVESTDADPGTRRKPAAGGSADIKLTDC